jgi:hypothetical protein
MHANRIFGPDSARKSIERIPVEERFGFGDALLPATAEVNVWVFIWARYVQCCAEHRVVYKPGRQFPGDRQEYRRNRRGLEPRMKERSGVDKHGSFNEEETKRIIGCDWKARPTKP